MKAHVIVLAAVLPVASAGAGVRIDVDPTAPFTEQDLAQAVNLRMSEQPREDIEVRVGRLGFEQLLVVVGDKTQTVALSDRDRAESARVVALIVTSMVNSNVAPPGDTLPARRAESRSTPSAWLSRLSLIVGASYEHQSTPPKYDYYYYYGSPEGFDLSSLRGGIAVAIRPGLRAVATVSRGQLSYDGGPSFQPKERIVPLRGGFEASSGFLGVELGAQRTWYKNNLCDGEWGHSSSVYGSVKVFLPLSNRIRGVLDVGGHYIIQDPFGFGSREPYCTPLATGIQYGGWAGAGVEWAL